MTFAVSGAFPVRFGFFSDAFCSSLGEPPLCGGPWEGVWVDDVQVEIAS